MLPETKDDLGGFVDEIADASSQWRREKSFGSLVSLVQRLYRAPADNPLAVKIFQMDWRDMLRVYISYEHRAWAVEVYLLTGLLKNARWKTLLRDESSARALAALVSSYLQRDHKTADQAMSSNPRAANSWILPKVRMVVEEWLGLVHRDEIFDPCTFASALFGQSWSVLVFEHGQAGVKLDKLIMQDRPAFMPGVEGAGIFHTGLALPTLDRF
jgi:hypothetical protein